MFQKYSYHLIFATLVFFTMVLHIGGTFQIPLIEEVEEYLYDTRLRWTMPRRKEGTRSRRWSASSLGVALPRPRGP